MNKKLLLLLTLTVGQAVAMEPLTIDDERAMPTETTKKRVVITIQDQERELSPKVIPLIRALAGFYVKDTPLQMSPITMVNLDTWQLIEDQLKRVYEITQGNQQVRDEIIADYSELDNNSFIDLIMAVDFLDIPLLKKITLEIAQKKLTFDEILELPELLSNEIIKHKAFSKAGSVPLKEIAVCSGHKGAVRSVCVTPDGKIVSGSHDNTVRIWDINGQELAVCDGPVRPVWTASDRGEVNSVCVTPGGKIVSRSKEKAVCIWNMNGKELVVCRGHEKLVTSVCVTHDDKIVSGSKDGTLRIWDMNGKQLAICKGRRGLYVTSFCVTPDGMIVSGSEDRIVRIWDMNGQQRGICRGHEGWVNSVCVTSDGKIVSGSNDHTVGIWDISGQQLAVCRGHEGMIESVCVTPDDKIVSGSLDNTVRIWDMNGKELAICRGHRGVIWSVCVTPDGKIISTSNDNTVRIWDMNGKELAVCRGHKACVDSACVTSDGKIVSGSQDKTVRVWDISLLDRLSIMSKNQAQAICKLIQPATCKNREQKEQCWKEIANIFEEEELPIQPATCENQGQKEQCQKEIANFFEEEELPNLSKWRSARAIKLMLILSVSIIAIWYLDHCEKQKHKDRCWKKITKILEEEEEEEELVGETKNGKES